jgi:hypothetical protein
LLQNGVLGDIVEIDDLHLRRMVLHQLVVGGLFRQLVGGGTGAKETDA